jgi:hypothetical protein
MVPEVPLLQLDLINNANNYYPNKFFDLASGRRINVNNVRTDIWGGPTDTYVFPAAGGIQMSVVSSSANDTLAGTGAQKVHIHYLDASYVKHEEVISTNGTTPVNTVATNILRINGLHVVQAGTGGTSAGNISLTSVGGATTYGYIEAGYNTARQAIYTIPAGKTGYIKHWQASSGTASGAHFTEFSLRTTSHYGVLWNGVFIASDSVGTLNNNAVMTFPIPIEVPATADVKVTAISDSGAANAICNCVIMGWIE